MSSRRHKAQCSHSFAAGNRIGAQCGAVVGLRRVFDHSAVVLVQLVVGMAKFGVQSVCRRRVRTRSHADTPHRHRTPRLPSQRSARTRQRVSKPLSTGRRGRPEERAESCACRRTRHAGRSLKKQGLISHACGRRVRTNLAWGAWVAGDPTCWTGPCTPARRRQLPKTRARPYP